MRLLAPAKINLTLRVGPKRVDGFHPLVSWMCTVGLFDTLILESSRPAGARVATPDFVRSAAIDARSTQAEDCCVSLHCDDPALPTDGRNLVVRAAELLARMSGDCGETPSLTRRTSTAQSDEARSIGDVVRSDRRASIQLLKRVPSGGGLGGGSSDAARALLGLTRLWQLDLSVDQLQELAAQLGSDVPFFLHGPSSVCTGRGEIVKTIGPPACRACVLILPAITTLTPGVFRRFDELTTVRSVGDWESQPRWEEWITLPALDLLPKLANDLEQPAYDMHPELRRLQQQARELLDRPVRMSGSGSSLFTLCDTLPEAERMVEKLREQLHIDSKAVTLAPTIEDDLSV
jgi:4-diphosphocytidyl-2-C-methyl-D-erythritol kinase